MRPRRTLSLSSSAHASRIVFCGFISSHCHLFPKEDNKGKLHSVYVVTSKATEPQLIFHCLLVLVH